MNKKLLIAYLLAAVLVYYIIHVYRSHHVVPAAVATKTAPVAAAPEIPVNKEAETMRARNQELINKYSAQIKSGKDVDGDVYYQRGLLYLSLQQYRVAIQDFSDAIRLVPDSPSAFYARALAYQGEHALDLAIADLNAAIKLKADFAEAYNTRAAIYDDQGNTDNAINDYKNALAINANFDQAYFNLGVLYEKQKQYSEAEAEFGNAISHNIAVANATPSDLAASKKRLLQAYIHRAGVALLVNDLNAALKDINYVIDSDPKNEIAYRLRANIYNKMGNTADSLADKATADNLSMQNLLEQH